MTGAWVALAALFAVLALPGREVARVDGLVHAGRVASRSPSAPARRPPPWVVPACAGAAAVGAVGAVALRAGAVLAVAATAVLATVALILRDVRAHRSALRVDAQVLTSVRVLVGELAAGSPPPAALDAAAHAAPLVAGGYAAAARAAARGDPAGARLTASGHPAIRAVGHAWAVAETQGSGLAGVLGRVVGDLEAAAAQRRATAVALAGPRSSAALLAGLPLLGIALGTAMGAHPLAFLLATAVGRAVCCAGVLLDVAGVVWVRHLLRRAGAPP